MPGYHNDLPPRSRRRVTYHKTRRPSIVAGPLGASTTRKKGSIPNHTPVRAALQDIERDLRLDGIIRHEPLPPKARNKRKQSGFLAAYPFWRSAVQQKLRSKSIDFTEEHDEHLRKLLSANTTPQRRYLLWIGRARNYRKRQLITDVDEFNDAMIKIAAALDKQRRKGGYLPTISEELAETHRIAISARDLIAVRNHLRNQTTQYLHGYA